MTTYAALIELGLVSWRMSIVVADRVCMRDDAIRLTFVRYYHVRGCMPSCTDRLNPIYPQPIVDNVQTYLPRVRYHQPAPACGCGQAKRRHGGPRGPMTSHRHGEGRDAGRVDAVPACLPACLPACAPAFFRHRYFVSSLRSSVPAGAVASDRGATATAQGWR